MARGMFIVFDGIDGSGKTVQTQLLYDHLAQLGYKVATPTFPRYDKDSSYFVRKMLQGGYEELGAVNPHVASMFYAFDRMDAALEMHKQLEEGTILISNRYTSSNIGHQGGRFKDVKERKAYYAWLDHFEYEQLHIPRPDMVVYLHMPVEMSIRLIHERFLTSGETKKDIYEGDEAHLRSAYQSYVEAAALFPYWRTVDCTQGETLLTPEEIHDAVWQKVQPLLEAHQGIEAHASV